MRGEAAAPGRCTLQQQCATAEQAISPQPNRPGGWRVRSGLPPSLPPDHACSVCLALSPTNIKLACHPGLTVMKDFSLARFVMRLMRVRSWPSLMLCSGRAGLAGRGEGRQGACRTSGAGFLPSRTPPTGGMPALQSGAIALCGAQARQPASPWAPHAQPVFAHADAVAVVGVQLSGRLLWRGLRLALGARRRLGAAGQHQGTGCDSGGHGHEGVKSVHGSGTQLAAGRSRAPNAAGGHPPCAAPTGWCWVLGRFL